MESLPDPVPEAPSAWGLAIILSVLDEPAMPPVMTATEVEAAASS